MVSSLSGACGVPAQRVVEQEAEIDHVSATTLNQSMKELTVTVMLVKKNFVTVTTVQVC